MIRTNKNPGTEKRQQTKSDKKKRNTFLYFDENKQTSRPNPKTQFKCTDSDLSEASLQSDHAH